MVYREFYIIYNNKTDADLGLYVKKRPSIPAPELDYEPIIIPGRDGFMMPKITRYDAITIRVEMNFLCSPEQYGERIREVKRWLTGTGELVMSDDQTVFYKVLEAHTENITRKSRELCTFDAVFVCDPYTYLQAGKKEISLEEAAFNAWHTCHPIYHIHTTATSWQLYVNLRAFSGTGADMQLEVDTDTQVAIDKTTGTRHAWVSTNAYSNLWLKPGRNLFYSVGCDVTITPRWRAL